MKSNTLLLSDDEKSLTATELIGQWRKEYIQVRPYNALGYRPPAPEAKIPVNLTL
jgi:hypothetical protein